MIVYDVLTGIANDIAIAGHLMGTNPVSNLITRHNRIAMVDDRIKKVDERTTGKELKDELSKHDPEIKVELLYNYIKAKKASMLNESGSMDELDDRRIYISTDPVLKRRASDNTDPNCKIEPTVSSVITPEIVAEKEEIDKTLINTIAIGGIVLIVILVVSISSFTGSDEHSKNMFETTISVLKVIFG